MTPENRNLIMAVALSMIVLLGWQILVIQPEMERWLLNKNESLLKWQSLVRDARNWPKRVCGKRHYRRRKCSDSESC